jgi:hypothetical protein
MADIYENAFVTIAATCAANSDDGLRPFKNRFKALRLGSSDFFVRESIPDSSSIHEAGPNSVWPLLSRAWAFQESQLAPRTLRFSCYGVVWDCRTIKAEEEKQTGRDMEDNTIDLLPFFSPLNSASGPEDAWHNTVEQYSSLDLTYRTDTLPAIAALAQRMARLRHNDTYLAGMWRSTLLSDIQWRTEGFHPRQESALPTWSWATTRGVYYAVDQHTLHGVEILSLDYTPVGPAEIGDIKDAVLTIRGPTSPLRLIASEFDMFNFCISHQVASWSGQMIRSIPDYNFSPEFCLDGSQVFLALFMSISKFTGSNGLVLRQVGTVYERVGWFFWRKRDAEKEELELLMEHVAELPLTTVHII